MSCLFYTGRKKNDISKCESIKPAIPETASRTAASLALYSEQLKPVC